MTAKTQALVRDLAGLFIKYNLADWQPVIAQIEARGGSSELTAAIRDLAMTAAAETAIAKSLAASRKKPKAKAKPKPKPPKAVEPFPLSEARVKILEPVREALKGRKLLSSASDLKSAYQALGIKTPQPARRDMVTDVIVRHLDGLSEERFDQAMAIVTRHEREPSTAGDAYSRWFNIILKPPAGSSTAD